MQHSLGKTRGRWARTLALLIAGALVASTCASESDRELGLPAGGEIADPDVVYVYDGHGRLQAVTDPTGDTAVYARDAAGNVTGIERYASDEPSIIEVTPRRAAQGDRVTVHGTGFGDDGDGSTVTIGGIEAEVADGSPFSLTVVVPPDAPVGDAGVAVETPDGPVATDITLAVDEHGAPVVTGFSPAVARPGGEVTIEGHGFAVDPLLDAVVLGGDTYARVTSASATELVVELPATATTGRLSVATPDGTGRSEDEVFVVPATVDVDAIALTRRSELGDATAVELADHEIAVIAFDGRRGRHVGVEIALAEGEDACGVSFGVVAPGGGVLLDSDDAVLQTRSLCDDGRVPPVAGPLPVDGTYTLVIDGGGGVDGLDVTVEEVTAPEPGESSGGEGPDDGDSGDEGSDDGDVVDEDVPGSGSDSDEGDGSSVDDGDADDDGTDPDAGTAEPPVRPEVTVVEPPEGADALAPPDSPHAGDPQFPVDLANGVLATHATDMVVPDTMPLVLGRSYTFTSTGGAWAFGKGSALEYDIDLRVGYGHRIADLELAAGISIPFDRTTDGYDVESAVFESTTAPSVFGGARLAWGGIGWDLRLPDGTTLVFHGERGGRLQAIRDANGNQVTIQRERDQRGRVTDTISSLTSPSGRTIRFHWHDRLLAEAIDDLGRMVTYAYDERDRLTSVLLPGGGALGYGYDEDGRLTTITGPGGATIVANEYDDDARVVRQVGPDGLAHTFAYAVDDRGRVTETTVTDPAGGVRKVRFEAGWWVSDTMAAGTPVEATVGVERDPDTRLVTAHVDATGARTTYDYDDLGFPTSVTAAAGTDDEATTTYAYESGFHRLAEVTDPAGRTTTYDYDGDGNLTSVVDAAGRATTFDIDRRGRVRAVTDPTGATTEIDHQLDHRVTVTDAAGVEVSEFTDAVGRPAVLTDGNGNHTRLRYDAADRVVAVDAPPTGASTEPVATTATYDAGGRLASLTDPSGAATRVERDAAGRVVARVDPLGARDTYAYDGLGNLVGHTDRRGVASTFAYDALGRQVRADYGVGLGEGGRAESTITYAYDPASRRAVVDDSAYGTVEITSDALGRLVSESGPGGTVTYGYDDAGQRTSLAVDDAETTYDYDDAGAPVTIASGDAEATAVQDDEGRVVAASLPNDVAASYGYDDAGRLAAMRYAIDDESLGGVDYGYDRNGRRIAAAGELVDVTVPDPVTGTAHDAANRLTSWDGAALAWDAAGNLVDDGTRTYTWDARGQLASVTGPVSATFGYDPFGRRVSQTVDEVTTVSVHDGLDVARQRTGDDQPVDYLGGLGIDDTLARVGPDGATTYLTDGLGSTMGLVDGGGTVATRYSRDPFGATTVDGDADDPNPFGFTGREHDETGLMHYRARYYAPELGRFISEDPLGAAGGDTNPYAYAGGDPANVTDPSGMCLEPATELLGQTFALLDYLLAVGDAEQAGTMTRDQAAAESDWVIRQSNANVDWFVAMCGSEVAFSGLGAITGGLGARLPSLSSRGGPGAGGLLPESADDLVDLASPVRRRHILDGEVRPNGTFGGGHRPGTGFPRKSEFPANWSDDQIMHRISDVATDPAAVLTPGRGGDVFVRGTRHGIDIEVLIRDGEIWTGYPTNVARNP